MGGYRERWDLHQILICSGQHLHFSFFSLVFTLLSSSLLSTCISLCFFLSLFSHPILSLHFIILYFTTKRTIFEWAFVNISFEFGFREKIIVRNEKINRGRLKFRHAKYDFFHRATFQFGCVLSNNYPQMPDKVITVNVWKLDT